jgi:hypothetical protein
VNVLKKFVSLILAITWIATAASRASEISLPNVGTNVNYDYALSTPQFVIAQDSPSEELIHSNVIFADNKRVFVEFQSDTPIVQIDLEFRGSNLYELFDPIFISFDEELSLTLDNGVVRLPIRNTGIGYYTEDPDLYIFSWSFFPDSGFSFNGLQWTISPDLINGAVLPAHVGIRVSFFAAGTIWVVPEPSSVVGMLIAGIGVCNFRRRRNEFAAISRLQRAVTGFSKIRTV